MNKIWNPTVLKSSDSLSFEAKVLEFLKEKSLSLWKIFKFWGKMLEFMKKSLSFLNAWVFKDYLTFLLLRVSFERYGAPTFIH